MSTRILTFSELLYSAKAPIHLLPFATWWRGRGGSRLSLPRRSPQSLSNGNPHIGENLLDGYFKFGTEMHQLDAKTWRFKSASKQWTEALHAFQWLYDLRAVNSDEARQAAAAMVLDWCLKYKSWRKTAWASASLIPRVTVWLSLFEFITMKMNPEQKRLVVQSLFEQSNHLASGYPADLVGVDRILAGITLINADLSFFDEVEQNYRGWRIVEVELRRQMLPDGGLQERSAEKTLILLQALIELRATLGHFEKQIPRTLGVAINMLSSLIEALQLPSGELSKFHCMPSVEQLTLVDRLLQFSGDRPEKLSFPDLGLERLVAKRSTLIFNTGKIGTKFENRSLHACPLAFEFSLGKQKLITNCGSHPDKERYGLLARSTAAHSTIVMSNKNTTPITAAKRQNIITLVPADTQHLTSHRQNERHEDEQNKSVRAEHNFYQTRGFGTISRHLQLSTDGEMLLGADVITGVKHAADVHIRFHLHPDVVPRLAESMVFLRLPSGRSWRLDCTAGASTSIEDSFYLNEGRVVPTRQIVLHAAITPSDSDAELSHKIQWSLAREGRAARRTL